MKVLKIIGLAILGFFLFFSLSVFGLAFTVNNTVLSPGFLPNQLDRLDVASLMEETLDSANSGLSSEIHDTLIHTVNSLEPQVKTQIRAANSQIYAYLLGRQQDIDLHQVLKDTVLSKEFIVSLLNETDTLTLVRQDLRDELADLIPPGQQQLVIYLDQAMPSLDPWLKEQINEVADPIVDYLLGDSPTLHIAIPLESMKSTLRSSLRSAFLNSPPPELAGAAPDQMEDIFNQYYQAFAAQLPANADIDPSSLGIENSDSLEQSLTDVKTVLADARKVIGYFRLGFILLIVFILLLVAGIILVHREVKGAARDLGIIFLTYGLLEYLGIIIGKYFINTGLPAADLPKAVQLWLPGLFSNFFRPLEILSLVLAVIGVGLIVLSIVYRRRQTQDVPPA